ncbi:MAG: hypothetical protein WCS97_01665 [Candidatus Paceibacterota bacterium]|jgi:hypothetical protein
MTLPSNTFGFSISSFVAGTMLGVLLAGAYFFGNDSLFLSTGLPSSFTATSTTQTAGESGAVSVADQPAGDIVMIESITVPPPGVWVAVREVQSNSLGNVLGAARVEGPRSALSVPLLRATVPEQSYVVQLYRDDAGSDFDPARNSVYVDFDTGAPVIAYFTTTS